MFRTATLLVLVACSGDSEEPLAERPLSGADLAGRWESTTCEAYPDGQGGNTYLTRSFVLTETDWHLDLAIFGDEACSYPLFDAVIDGPYTLGELSSAVEGATEGQFHIASSVWTARDPSLADLFTTSGCGDQPWEVGVGQDVTETGCIGVAHPASECPDGEHDLVGIEGDLLYFGERITDLCDPAGRPKALGPYGLARTSER